MVIPNTFLWKSGEHNTIIGNCFCDICRRLRMEEFVERNLTEGQMYYEFTHLLPRKESMSLNKVFADTLNIIISGKVYRDTCLQGSGYAYFRSWAKHEPLLSTLPDKQFNVFCHRVNEASWVFDNWDRIVNNLTDEKGVCNRSEEVIVGTTVSCEEHRLVSIIE